MTFLLPSIMSIVFSIFVHILLFLSFLAMAAPISSIGGSFLVEHLDFKENGTVLDLWEFSLLSCCWFFVE